jgi:co-chaperonin GroES (HSP10)
MLVPRHDLVLVRLEPIESASSGGILLPENSRTNSERYGVIEAFGPGRTLDSGNKAELSDISVGDRVLLESMSVYMLEEDLCLARDASILCVLKDDVE